MILKKTHFKNIDLLESKIKKTEIEFSLYKESNIFENIKRINMKMQNIFLIGEKESYDLFQIISRQSLEILKNNQINISKNKYHVRSEIINLNKGIYDFDNQKNFCINGYVFFNKNSIKINNEKIDVERGDIVFLNTSLDHHIFYDLNGIVFNVSPCSTLHSQFLGQWIPILEEKND